MWKIYEVQIIRSQSEVLSFCAFMKDAANRPFTASLLHHTYTYEPLCLWTAQTGSYFLFWKLKEISEFLFFCHLPSQRNNWNKSKEEYVHAVAYFEVFCSYCIVLQDRKPSKYERKEPNITSKMHQNLWIHEIWGWTSLCCIYSENRLGCQMKGAVRAAMISEGPSYYTVLNLESWKGLCGVFSSAVQGQTAFTI